jgi:hypothetical protein
MSDEGNTSTRIVQAKAPTTVLFRAEASLDRLTSQATPREHVEGLVLARAGGQAPVRARENAEEAALGAVPPELAFPLAPYGERDASIRSAPTAST